MKSLKILLQAVLTLLGISIYTKQTKFSFPYPRQSQFGVLHIMKKYGDLKFKTVIDIGAGDGTSSINRVFDRNNFIYIEPLDVFEKSLTKLVNQKSANREYFKVLLYSDADTLNFYVHEDHYGSTVKQEFETIKNANPVTLNSETLDNLMKRSNLDGPYFIKMDTQGSEFEILQGALETLAKAEALLLEVSIQDFFMGSHTLIELLNFLNEKGFRIFDIADLTYRPSDGFLAQFDILFVRVSSKLFEIKNYE